MQFLGIKFKTQSVCRWEEEGAKSKVQVGAGGAIKIRDVHGVTGDRDVRIGMREKKKYKVEVSWLGREVGETKVPLSIFYYHDVYSEETRDEEGEQI